MKKVQAPCAVCHVTTVQEILHEAVRAEDDIIDTYALLSCGGCETVSMGRQRRWPGGELEHTYYPSPASRRRPEWLWTLTFGLSGRKNDDELGQLLEEIYQAVAGRQYRLAGMGIRALLERIMIAKIGDQGTFVANLKEFHKKEFISTIQRDAMSKILEAGHAIAHRSFKPSERDLTIALDITEGIIASIFVHADAANELAKRVPPRQARPKNK
jgi:hypothetical protein